MLNISDTSLSVGGKTSQGRLIACLRQDLNRIRIQGRKACITNHAMGGIDGSQCQVD
jgi:hypothetical protein